MLARGRVRGADAAMVRLVPLMAEFDRSRLWAQRYSWLDGDGGQVEGDDVITDSAFVLYGGLFSVLNVRTSLFGGGALGVEVLGPAAAGLEGVNFTIGVRGRDLLLAVVNGSVQVSVAAPF
jgi:hypothetical protein